MFAKLESLRGIAACIVVLYHSPFSYGNEPLGFIANGYLFVDLFFIISGFVMSYAYAEKIGRTLSFKSYIALRLGRIYPLHFFMLLVWVPYILVKQYLFLSGFGGNDQFEASNLYSFSTNLVLLHSMGLHDKLNWNYPSWSISVEFFAYITFYFLIVSIDKKKTLLVPLCIVLACYVFLFSLNRSDLNIMSDFGFFRCLGGFYLGVLVFRLKSSLLLPKRLPCINVMEAAIVALLFVFIAYSGLNKLVLVLVIIAFFIAVIVFVSEENGYIGTLLESSWMRSLGVWSYSIYMVHGIILAGISNIFEYILKINLDVGFGFLAIIYNIFILGVIVFLSKYTYVYIEQRFRNIVKRKVNQANESKFAV